MTLDLLNTVASFGTFIVIGATAVAALIQLRHMRNSNQLTGLLEVLSRVEDPVFNEWLDRSLAGSRSNQRRNARERRQGAAEKPVRSLRTIVVTR